MWRGLFPAAIGGSGMFALPCCVPDAFVHELQLVCTHVLIGAYWTYHTSSAGSFRRHVKLTEIAHQLLNLTLALM